jgi:3-oxoacyl-[acyl-carrier protein] reductase
LFHIITMPGDRLKGKVAIVTGGGSGFGAGIVKKFVHEGCLVMIWDICPEPAMTLSSNLPPKSTSVFIGDVSNPEHWVSALEQCLQTFGQLHILVNNAGVVHVSAPSEEVAEEEVDRMWRVNFKPLYHSAKIVVPYFKGRGGGVVINLSSISAPRPRPRLVWYAASKGAVTAVSELWFWKG